MENYPKIKILGIGDYGISVVEEISNNHIDNIEYLNLNTDWAFFNQHKNPSLKLGPRITKGIGSGGLSFWGKQAAEDSRKDIIEKIKDAGLIIIVTGLGGGTGSGVSPVVASIAKELNIPAIAFVTIPLEIEGKTRYKNSEDSLKELKDVVGSLKIISLDKSRTMTSRTLHDKMYDLNSLMQNSVLEIINLLKEKSINEISKLYINKNAFGS